MRFVGGKIIISWERKQLSASDNNSLKIHMTVVIVAQKNSNKTQTFHVNGQSNTLNYCQNVPAGN